MRRRRLSGVHAPNSADSSTIVCVAPVLLALWSHSRSRPNHALLSLAVAYAGIAVTRPFEGRVYSRGRYSSARNDSRWIFESLRIGGFAPCATS